MFLINTGTPYMIGFVPEWCGRKQMVKNLGQRLKSHSGEPVRGTWDAAEGLLHPSNTD